MKRKVLLGLLLFISLFVLCGCDFWKKDTPKEETKKEAKSDKRELSYEETKELMDFIEDLQYFNYFAESYKVKEFPNQEMLMALYYMVDSFDGIEFKELEEIAKKNFDYELKAEDFMCFAHSDVNDIESYLYLYNKKTGKYKYNDEHWGHGGGGFGSAVYNRYADAYFEDGIYVLKVYKAFSDIWGDVSEDEENYYPTYGDALDMTNPLFDITYNDYYIPNKDPQKLLDNLDTDKLVTHTYTFKKVDDHYVFISYEIGK